MCIRDRSHTAATAADPSVHAAEETTDQVFLLSLAEAKQYFANNAARVAQDVYKRQPTS